MPKSLTPHTLHQGGGEARIAIIGAGVTGLTCANHLLSLLPLSPVRYHITLIARHFPDNYDRSDYDYPYTSPWAGANWRSLEEKNERVMGLEGDTFGYLMRNGDGLTGINQVRGMDYYGTQKRDDPPPWFKDLVPEVC